MSDDNNDNGRPAGGRAPLTLKPRAPGGQVTTGTVKQQFSHGRTKSVVVETKRRRPEGPPPGAGVFREREPLPPVARPRPEAPAAAAPPAAPPPATPNDGLSESERQKRAQALGVVRAEQERVEAIRRAEEAARRAEEDARRREAEAARAAAEAQRRAAEEAARPAPPPTPVAPPPAPATPPPAEASRPAPARPSMPVVAPPLVVERPTLPPPVGRAPTPVYGERPRSSPSYGDRPRPAGGSTYGDRPRPASGGASYGDRPRPAGGSSYGDRPAARYGDRPAGGAGADRPATYGDRPRPAGGAGYGARPAGGAPAYGDRPRTPRPEGGYPSRDGAPRTGGYGDRPPREGGPGNYGDRPRGPRPEGGYPAREGGSRPGGDRPRPAGGGEGTVRYSALSPRPAGPRPGGPAGARDSAPELTKTSRAGPRGNEAARRPGAEDDDGRRSRAGVPAPRSTLAPRGKGGPVRREGRLTIQAVAGDEDAADRMRSLASVRRAREREKEKRRGGIAEPSRVAREVVIPDVITVGELAQRMAIRAVDVIKFMMRQGIMLKINDVIDTDTAELVATEYGMSVRRVSESDVETGFLSEDNDEGAGAVSRPPVVAVMGHVDHGKTSLLDSLRKTSVVSGEAGGITQHIGAYQVTTADGQHVTFLDTPGHAAFSAMRARGANVTDIVVLVVAADDGVMPQTIEAINHAKSSGAPIIVAANKIDKPDADPTRVINELLQHEIVAESLGGETQIIEVSATQKLGLDDLIQGILLQAEVMDLRADPARTGEGVVIEAKLDKGRGPVATVLVKRGTLKRGDIVVAGAQWGRVRALVDENGKQQPTAGPSEPAEVLGLDGAPEPGEAMAVVENEARAREIVEYRQRVKREKSIGLTGGVSMAEMMAKLQKKNVSELPLVIKADVGGSAEAIRTSLEKIGTDEVSARIILSGVGGISESDVLLAKGANAPIIGFNVRASAPARQLAEREGVEIRYYAIIYDLLDDIKGVLSGMLAPIQRETFLGNAEVLQVFDISKVGKAAGVKVTEGVVRKGAKVRILRNDVVIQEMGTLVTLKRFKDEVNEVVVGQECGMSFGNYQDVKEGDLIECFTVEEIKRTLA